MRRGALLAALALFGAIGGGCLPVGVARAASEAKDVSERAMTVRYGEAIAPIMRELNRTTASDDAYLESETVRLAKAKDETGIRVLQIGYLRQCQRVAVKAMSEIDALGQVPPKFARLVDLQRKILKLRIASGRSGAVALAEDDMARVEAVVAREERELPPLQRELATEAKALIAEGEAMVADAEKVKGEG